MPFPNCETMKECVCSRLDEYRPGYREGSAPEDSRYKHPGALRQSPHDTAEGLCKYDERRSADHENFVFDHVREKQSLAEPMERANQSKGQSAPPKGEAANLRATDASANAR